MDHQNNILVIGYGNPGRQDDGLGPALIEKLEINKPDFMELESNYQLTVEDAFTVAQFGTVVFVDATLDGREPYSFDHLNPGTDGSVTSHAISPQTVLSLACTLFQAETKAYLLGIRGYEFDQFEEQLSPKAAGNLEHSYDFLIKKCQSLL